MNYEVPSTLEAVVSVFMIYVCSGEAKVRRYGDHSWAYSRCKEQINGGAVLVGGFDHSGLCVSCYYDDDRRYDIGVGALRRF